TASLWVKLSVWLWMVYSLVPAQLPKKILSLLPWFLKLVSRRVSLPRSMANVKSLQAPFLLLPNSAALGFSKFTNVLDLILVHLVAHTALPSLLTELVKVKSGCLHKIVTSVIVWVRALSATWPLLLPLLPHLSI